MSVARVMVVGSLNLDSAHRLPALPRPGQTVVAREVATALGGKGANQAVAAARAGAAVRMVGAVGADAAGTLMRAELEAAGVDGDGVLVLADVPSGSAVVLVADDAENTIVVVPGANAHIPDEHVRRACAQLAPGDVVLLQGEVPAATNDLAAQLAHQAGAVVVWNAAPAPASREHVPAHLDVVVVNEHELVTLAEHLGAAPAPVRATAQTTVRAQLAHVAAALGADVVCTLGAAGARYQVAGRAGSVPALPVEAVDTTAAGDTYVGYLGALAALPVEARLTLAAAAAAVTVTRRGATASIADLPTARDLLARAAAAPAPDDLAGLVPDP